MIIDAVCIADLTFAKKVSQYSRNLVLFTNSAQFTKNCIILHLLTVIPSKNKLLQ